MEQQRVIYDKDESGVLHIYMGSAILAEISDCGRMGKRRTEKLIEEILYDMGYMWLSDGTVKKIKGGH